MRIGVLSDTHGLVRDELFEVFRGVQMLIHAGDVGGGDVLQQLRDIAPVHAVRGNMDKGSFADLLPRDKVVQIGAAMVYVIHDIHKLELDPAASGFKAVVCGHSHRPAAETKDGVLFLNPGSAGPKRFSLPVSAAMMTVDYDGSINHEFVSLA